MFQKPGFFERILQLKLICTTAGPGFFSWESLFIKARFWRSELGITSGVAARSLTPGVAEINWARLTELKNGVTILESLE